MAELVTPALVAQLNAEQVRAPLRVRLALPAGLADATCAVCAAAQQPSGAALPGVTAENAAAFVLALCRAATEARARRRRQRRKRPHAD